MKNTFVCSAPLERREIERLMPHAPAWVLVDRVLDYRPRSYIRTQKLIARNDAFLKAHFQDRLPVYPGVLLIEYASQSAYLLDRLGHPEPPPVLLLARCSATFLSPARAGDLLTAEVTQLDRVRDVIVCEGTVSCGDRVVCHVRIFAAPVQKEGSNPIPESGNGASSQ